MTNQRPFCSSLLRSCHWSPHAMLLWGEVLHDNPNNGCKGDQFCLGDVTLCLGSEHAALQYLQNLTNYNFDADSNQR